MRRTAAGDVVDLTPPLYNARTRVHEYGGGSVHIAGQTVYFTNFEDQQIYSQVINSSHATLITSGNEQMRYADYQLDSARNSLVGVREDHTQEGKEAQNTIVQISLNGSAGDGEVLVSGYDFYSSPRLNRDGTQLAWHCWNHPNMPWDDSELWVGDLNEAGKVVSSRRIAGGIGESTSEPKWAWDGILYFISDRTNWWNLYRWDGESIELVYGMDVDMGLPAWQFGMSTYVLESAKSLLCTFSSIGGVELARIDLKSLTMTKIETMFNSIRGLSYHAGQVGFVGGSATDPQAAVKLNLISGDIDVLRTSCRTYFDKSFYSIPEFVEFPTENNMSAFGYYYPPTNRDYKGPGDEKPPLIVEIHGGPTASAVPALNLGVQFWTSRGFAILDVDYAGSTGYGREYRYLVFFLPIHVGAMH